MEILEPLEIFSLNELIVFGFSPNNLCTRLVKFCFFKPKNLIASKTLNVPKPVTSDVYSGISNECPT